MHSPAAPDAAPFVSAAPAASDVLAVDETRDEISLGRVGRCCALTCGCSCFF